MHISICLLFSLILSSHRPSSSLSIMKDLWVEILQILRFGASCSYIKPHSHCVLRLFFLFTLVPPILTHITANWFPKWPCPIRPKCGHQGHKMGMILYLGINLSIKTLGKKIVVIKSMPLSNLAIWLFPLSF